MRMSRKKPAWLTQVLGNGKTRCNTEGNWYELKSCKLIVPSLSQICKRTVTKHKNKRDEALNE